jgi:hypothetical protein
MDKEHDAANQAQREQDAVDAAYFGDLDAASIRDFDDSPDNALNSGNPKLARSIEEQSEIEERMALDGVLCIIKGCDKPAIKTHCVVDPAEFSDYETWPTMDLCGQHSAQIEALRAMDNRC